MFLAAFISFYFRYADGFRLSEVCGLIGGNVYLQHPVISSCSDLFPSSLSKTN